MRNGHRDIFIGNFAKRPVNIAERLGDATDDIERCGQCQREDHRTDGEGLENFCANLRGQIVDVNTGDDNDLPGFESQRVGAFAKSSPSMPGFGP